MSSRSPRPPVVVCRRAHACPSAAPRRLSFLGALDPLRYYDAHEPKYRWLTPADERTFVASVGKAAAASRFIAQRHV